MVGVSVGHKTSMGCGGSGRGAYDKHGMWQEWEGDVMRCSRSRRWKA